MLEKNPHYYDNIELDDLVIIPHGFKFKELTLQERFVYAIILRANIKSPEYYTNISNKEIAQFANMSLTQVSVHLNNLIKKGYIIKLKYANGSNRRLQVNEDKLFGR